MNGIRIHLILFSLLMTGIACYSQSPNLISYQTVIRNGNNELVSNSTIGVRISILGGPEANVLVYQEEHTVKTNINGLAYLTIGNGTILNGLITSIDWSKGPYFIKSETDPTGGKNYSIVVLSQMLSVPYAIYSSTAEKLTGTLPEKDPLFNGSIAKGITATDTSYWNRKLNSTDTSRMLANYLKKSDAITTGGVETDPVFNGSIAKGITASDTSYWNKKLNTSDTSGMLANYRTSLNQKLNITDTAKMLTPYLRDADTSIMLANYRTGINNKLDAKDTTSMLSNYLKKSEASSLVGVETDPVFNGSIAKGITATDTSYWNKKLNTSDTSGMLANYRTSINNKLDAKDTTSMLSNYLKKSETINEIDPVFNGSIAKGITSTDTSNWNRKLSLPAENNNLGDILFWDGNKWSNIKKGQQNQVLTISTDGLPTWRNINNSNLPNIKNIDIHYSENRNLIYVSGEVLPGPQATGYGIAYSLNSDPTVYDNYQTTNLKNGSIFHMFSSLNNYLDSTNIYIRTYGSNDNGINYGENFIINNKPKSSIHYLVGNVGPAGGIIIYDKGIYTDGWRYIEASPLDLQNEYHEGGCGSIHFIRRYHITEEVGIGFGAPNTYNLMLPDSYNPFCSDKYFPPTNAVIKFKLNGFNDWVIPSKQELLLIYNQKNSFNTNSFDNKLYWTSNWYDDANPWALNFQNGQWASVIGNYGVSAKIRPIRYF